MFRLGTAHPSLDKLFQTIGSSDTLWALSFIASVYLPFILCFNHTPLLRYGQAYHTARLTTDVAVIFLVLFIAAPSTD